MLNFVSEGDRLKMQEIQCRAGEGDGVIVENEASFCSSLWWHWYCFFLKKGMHTGAGYHSDNK